MLLREVESGVLAIGQPAHAWVSGQLARAWGNERFGSVFPREEVCLGAEQHDLGMSAWERRPTLNPETGLPHSFMELPLEEHLRMWSEAPLLALAQSRYAALLVSLHGSALYERRDPGSGPPERARAIRDFLERQRAVQEELLAGLRTDPAHEEAATPEVVLRNRRLVWTWDFLSLALCLGWAPCPVEDVPAAAGTERLRLAPAEGHPGRFTLVPWPFSQEPVALRCEGRRLEERFEDEESMRAALERAPWVTLELELVPEPGW
jgi:Protein of unknown function (DUF3891)